MRYLVTGGAGFIGSHLCKKLIQNGEEVICVDNLYTGKKSNIEDLFQNSNFEFLRHDITFPLYIEADRIFNLACPASPIYYQNDPVQTIKTNVHGSINILGLAKRLNVRILQASTSEVYGDPKIHPQKENYWGNVNPIGKRACYDEGKRAAETLFFDYYRQYNVDIKVVRIFNTFGPLMRINDGRVITNFISQAIMDKPLTVNGNGEQTRSFCYIDDLVMGLIKMMNNDSITGPINLGNPQEIKIIDIANEIINLLNSKSKIIFTDLPEDDPLKRKPDISLAIKLLDWKPIYDRKNGLIKTTESIKQQLDLNK